MAFSYENLNTAIVLLQSFSINIISLASSSTLSHFSSNSTFGWQNGATSTDGRHILELAHSRSIPPANSVTDLAAPMTFNMSLPGCPETCGNITIPYPFGTRPGCYREGFDITCNKSTTPPIPYLHSGNIELAYINLTSSESRIYKHIAHLCYNQSNQAVNNKASRAGLNLTGSSYLISRSRNKFTAIGCYNLAYIVGRGKNSYQSGCESFCQSLNSTTGDNSTCDGLGCCQTAIPAQLRYYEVQWEYEDWNPAWDFNPCKYAVVVEEDWYKFEVDDLIGTNFLSRSDKVPMVLDWAIRDNGTCQDSDAEKRTYSACLSKNSRCYNTTNGEGYMCKCLNGYDGNPYIFDGCKDINECESPKKYLCYGECKNIDGGYECSCRKGTKGNATIGVCNKDPALVVIPSILGIGILMGLCFLVATYLQHKSHIKEKEEYQRYYQMMDSHLRVFSKKEIENATNNFGEDHVLGAGGQGKVYKGRLENSQIVAIKTAKTEVEGIQRGEFVNEIILLSQINHKNIVRLLGCCLEVKVPTLVYEFVPNGSLFDLLHGKRRKPIALSVHLKIALESAMALDYLHSSISCSILHGDVKSANILLDADYTVKVSDFGASSVIPLNEIVKLVHFSHGYLDPECMCTETITKMSDVYSFGVVILELVTRREAVYLNENGKREPLATSFLSRANKNEHHQMLDVEIVSDDEEVTELIEEICMIAGKCLSPKGEDRPTMRQVAEELQRLVRSHSNLPGQQIDPKETDSLLEEPQFDHVLDASVSVSTEYRSVLEISTEAAR